MTNAARMRKMTAAATAARIIRIDVLLSVAESVGTSVAGVGAGD